MGEYDLPPRIQPDQRPERPLIDTVAIVIMSPNQQEVLLEDRKKEDIASIISGRGPFQEHPTDPQKVAKREVAHDTGMNEDDVELTRLLVDNNIAVFFTTVRDKKDALNEKGHGKNRRWVNIKKAAYHMRLAYGQEKYVRALYEKLHS